MQAPPPEPSPRERAIDRIEKLAIVLLVEADADAEAMGSTWSPVHFYSSALGRLAILARSVPEGHTLASESTPRDGLRFFYAPTRESLRKSRPELRLLQGGLARGTP